MSFNIINEPWVESPFFIKYLNLKKSYFKKYAIDIHEKGYCILDLNLSDKVINDVNNDIERSISTGDFRKNPKIYHYNKYPRIVEAWKFSKNVAKIANNVVFEKIIKFFIRIKTFAIFYNKFYWWF